MEPAAIPVAILVGGRGTRLSGLTDKPKPLIEVGGRPFITYLLAALHQQGFRRCFFLTGYASAEFESQLSAEAGRARSSFMRDLDLTCIAEEAPLGTGGALRSLAPHIDRHALVLNGDSYCAIEYGALLGLLGTWSAAFCLAAICVEDVRDFGSLRLSDEGHLRGFEEKGARGPGWINTGIYGLEKRFLEEALPERPCSLEREILPTWIESETVPTLTTRGFFHDIGTPERLAQADAIFPPPDLLWLE